MTVSPKEHKNIYLYFLRRYPKQSVIVVAAFILSALAEMLGIGVVLPVVATVIDSKQQFSDNVLSSSVRDIFAFLGLPGSLGVMLAFMVGAIVTKALIIFAVMRYVSFVATDISRDLRVSLIDALMRAKWSYYSLIPVGRISNMLSNEGQRAGNCYLLAGKTVSSMFQLMVYVVAAFVVSWQVTFFAVLLGGILVFSLRTVVRMARSSGQEMTVSLNRLLSRMGDSLMMVKPIRAMGEEERFITLLDKDTKEILGAQRKQYISNQLLQVVYEPAIVTVMSVGLYLMITFTEIPAPELLLLAFLFQRLMNYANLSQNNYQNTIQNENAVWSMTSQISEAVEMAEKFNEGAGGREVKLSRNIRMEGINFGYDEHNVLNDFSCEIMAGKINLLFGPSGSGKSSLIDIVTGMNKTRSGSISVDGTDFGDLDIKAWRRKIGYVPQETILLHDSIRNNISLGSECYDDEAIWDALRKSGLEDFVKSLPCGLDTSVGERGTALSGGQRQRVALARAIVRNPDILIMDEATTGLDKESEMQIMETVRRLAGGVTIIMISHDPEIRKVADNIITLSRD